MPKLIPPQKPYEHDLHSLVQVNDSTQGNSAQNCGARNKVIATIKMTLHHQHGSSRNYTRACL